MRGRNFENAALGLNPVVNLLRLSRGPDFDCLVLGGQQGIPEFIREKRLDLFDFSQKPRPAGIALAPFRDVGISPIANEEEAPGWERITVTLADLADALISSSQGQVMLQQYYEARHSRSIGVEIVSEDQGVLAIFELDLVDGSVRRVHTSSATTGIRIEKCGLDDVLSGRLELWDLAGTSLRCWHPVTDAMGMMPFLYFYFSGANQPRLAASALAARTSFGGAR